MRKNIDYLISESAHYWAPPPDVSPAVIHVNEAYRRSLDPTVRLSYQWWALDYVFDPWQLGKIGTKGTKWFKRDAYTGFLYSPGTVYQEQLKHNTHAAWIGFRGGEKAGLQSLVKRRGGWALFRDPDHILGEHLVSMARSAHKRQNTGFYEAQAGLWQLFDMLHAADTHGRGEYVIRRDRAKDVYSPFAREVRGYLSLHLSDHITLDDIAKHMGISTSGLSHRYKKEIHESPMRTHLRMRLVKARQLLLQGYKLQAIADETGFATGFHLSAIFKRIEGVSPSAFLASVSKGA